MVVPNNHGFSYSKWSFWGVLGVPPFKETPIYIYINMFIYYVCWLINYNYRCTLPETNSSHLKMDPWKRRFLLETIIFRGHASFFFSGIVSWPFLRTVDVPFWSTWMFQPLLAISIWSRCLVNAWCTHVMRMTGTRRRKSEGSDRSTDQHGKENHPVIRIDSPWGYPRWLHHVLPTFG